VLWKNLILEHKTQFLLSLVVILMPLEIKIHTKGYMKKQTSVKHKNESDIESKINIKKKNLSEVLRTQRRHPEEG
jgi:hypothetical protein